MQKNVVAMHIHFLYLQSTKLEGTWSSPLGYKYFMYAKIAA